LSDPAFTIALALGDKHDCLIRSTPYPNTRDRIIIGRRCFHWSGWPQYYSTRYFRRSVANHGTVPWLAFKKSFFNFILNLFYCVFLYIRYS